MTEVGDTEISWYVPPEPIVAGDNFSVMGWLYHYVTPTIRMALAGATISLWTRRWVDGEAITRKLGNGTTDYFGKVIWNVSFIYGTHEMWITFAGDGTHNPSTTPIFTVIVVGRKTYMDLLDLPTEAGIGEPFYICGESGTFRDSVKYGETSRTVELLRDGVVVKSGITGVEWGESYWRYGRWRFAGPAFQTLGQHTIEVRFLGDEIHEPSSTGVLPITVLESGVVPTIERVHVPTMVRPGDTWVGYFWLYNRGTATGNVNAVIEGDLGNMMGGETPILTLDPGAGQVVAIGGIGPRTFTIRTGG